jgi:hypothetical protein
VALLLLTLNWLYFRWLYTTSTRSHGSSHRSARPYFIASRIALVGAVLVAAGLMATIALSAVP